MCGQSCVGSPTSFAAHRFIDADSKRKILRLTGRPSGQRRFGEGDFHRGPVVLARVLHGRRPVDHFGEELVPESYIASRGSAARGVLSTTMGIGNSLASAVLQSPLHPVLSGSTSLVRYVGRKTGRTFSTPTRYLKHGDELIILVGRSETKNWWRNFRSDHAVDVLVQGHWLPMIGRVVEGTSDLEWVAPVLELYLKRFPKAVPLLPGDTPEARARRAVVVWCQPRLARIEATRTFHLPHPHLPHLEIQPIDIDPA